ncbi:MAG: thioredoxin domain-containing protein, partial [Acidobacteriota bacterium]
DILFQRQPEWGERHGPPTSTPPPDVDALFEKYAMEVGLDIKKIAEATKENRYQVKLNRDKQDGQSLGVRQTPTLFVNGRRLVRLGESDLKAMIDEELKK